MENKNVFITGSASGLGKETARAFTAAGYRVFAGVRRAEDAAEVAALGPTVVPIVLDVADTRQIAVAACEIDRACGDDGLAVLVNAAGRNLYGPVEHVVRAEATALFEVLTFGPVALTNALLPALKRHARRGAGRAKVLNVISWASLDANPFVGFYAAAKAALLRLSQAQSLELERFGVDVVAVVPGLMKTAMIDKAPAQVDAALQRLPAHGREDYGAALAHMSTMSASASQAPIAAAPTKIAKRIVRIAALRRPRERYDLGVDTALVRFMNAAFPACLLRSMKRSLFALGPRPALTAEASS